MQYVLGFAILCKKYKKNPIARLFIDNQFIDEFIVDDTTKSFDGPIWPGSKLGPTDEGLRLNFATKYKMCEVNERIFKNNSKIKFEIQNEDSNWVNGFMTKSTLIAMHCIFLIPKTLLKRYKLIFKAFYKHRRIYEEQKSKLGVSSTNRNKWTTLNPGWPLGVVGRQFNKPTVFHASWIGDNATIEFNVQKKYGIYMFLDPEQAEYKFLPLSRLISGLCSFDNFDKYLHEN